MKRRIALAMVGGIIGTSISGCTELSAVINSDDQETSDDSNPSTSQGGQSTDSEDGANDENEQSIRDILETYSDGVSVSNSAINDREDGVGAWNDDNYENALRSFESAESGFSEAMSQFEDAADLTYDVTNTEAREICDTARKHASLMWEAMRYSQQMVDAAQDENHDLANDHLDTVRDLESQANRVNRRETSTLETVLRPE